MNQTDFNDVEVRRLLAETFGQTCHLERVEVFKAGARKQVYFLDLTLPNMRCAMYIWHDLNNYFTEREAFETQSDTQAPLLFNANLALFERLGIRTPNVYRFGQLETGYAFALIEYISAKNFTAFSQSASPEARDTVLKRIGSMLLTLNNEQRPFPGTVLAEASLQFVPCSDGILERALLELRVSASHHAVVAQHFERIDTKLRTMSSELQPRTSYRLIHGELGPEHILIAQENDEPCFIDIEGAHFFDVEAEHALLSYRFGLDLYQTYFQRDDLDQDRMRFYRFALLVSFVFAGSRFLAKNFHDQEWAQGLFDHSLEQVLASL
jgi:aminoglycoside phosphotransferase (APT) family kinase protein